MWLTFLGITLWWMRDSTTAAHFFFGYLFVESFPSSVWISASDMSVQQRSDRRGEWCIYVESDKTFTSAVNNTKLIIWINLKLAKGKFGFRLCIDSNSFRFIFFSSSLHVQPFRFRFHAILKSENSKHENALLSWRVCECVRAASSARYLKCGNLYGCVCVCEWSRYGKWNIKENWNGIDERKV